MKIVIRFKTHWAATYHVDKQWYASGPGSGSYRLLLVNFKMKESHKFTYQACMEFRSCSVGFLKIWYMIDPPTSTRRPKCRQCWCWATRLVHLRLKFSWCWATRLVSTAPRGTAMYVVLHRSRSLHTPDVPNFYMLKKEGKSAQDLWILLEINIPTCDR